MMNFHFKLKSIIKNVRIARNKRICKSRGHVDKRILVDGDSVHLNSGCFLRVRICDRCGRWEIMSKDENRFGQITWGVVS